MTQSEYQRLEERLREIDSPEPPLGLVDELRSDISPRPVAVISDGGDTADRGFVGPGHRGRWLVAASVAVALIGGSLAFRLSRSSSPAESFATVEGHTNFVQGQRSPTRPVDESNSLVEERTSGEDPQRDPFGQLNTLKAPAMSPSAAPERPETETLRQLRDQLPPEAFDEAVTKAARSEPRLRKREAEERAGVTAVMSEAPLMRNYRRVPAEPAPPSTGGSAELNDQPYGDTFFQSYGVNPFIDTEDDRLSTFAMDVDTGSYTMARSYIERGHLPPPEAIRVEETVNFFDYGDAAPVSDEGPRQDFAIRAEGAPTPFGQGPAYRLLRFSVRGREVTAAERKPATLIFVVDVSGSMNRENRLGLVRRSLGLLLDQLRDDDHVGLVVYGSQGRVLLEPTNDREAIRTAIEQLYPQGSTNAEEGLVLAYDLAENHFRPGAINRLVLCSDGVANVGRTGPDSILARIGSAAEGGIELTAVGFGMGNYNDILMEQLADRGDGNYAYVDNLEEARRIFVENLTGTLQTIAREAKIQVEFNPEVVSRYRLLGYENRDVADERFRDDTVDAGEIGAGHSVTALYEIKLLEGAKKRAELATLRLRYQPADGGAVVESTEVLYLRDLAPSWERASAALRLASLVAEYAEILRHSFWAREGDLEDVFTRAQGVSAEFEGDIDVAEFVGLVGKALRLVPTQD